MNIMNVLQTIKIGKVSSKDLHGATDYLALMPTALFNKLKVPPNSYLPIKCGTVQILIKIIQNDFSDVLLLSDCTLKSLGLYEGLETSLLFQGENGILHLGPVLGVFVSNGAINRIINGEATFKISELMKGNLEAKTILYFFSIKDLNWANKTIRGFTYRFDTNQWERRIFPFPDVLYDRGGGFLRSQLPVARYIRKQFLNIPGLKKINYQHYFNKWHVYSKLSKEEGLKTHLPETALFKDDGSLKEMLTKYWVVYLKSCEGSNGIEVLRVIKKPESTYNISCYDNSLLNEDVKSFDLLLLEINSFFKNKKFIVQQGIDVFTFHNRNVDIRVLCQRDGSGHWQITDLPVRIAAGNCPVTSTKSGSEVYGYSQAFLDLFGFSHGEVQRIKDDIIALSFKIIEALENEFGQFGEIGIDIAFDKNGKLWLIETNAKPGKDTVFITGNKQACDNAFTLPLLYARHIAGFFIE